MLHVYYFRCARVTDSDITVLFDRIPEVNIEYFFDLKKLDAMLCSKEAS